MKSVRILPVITLKPVRWAEGQFRYGNIESDLLYLAVAVELNFYVCKLLSVAHATVDVSKGEEGDAIGFKATLDHILVCL